MGTLQVNGKLFNGIMAQIPPKAIKALERKSLLLNYTPIKSVVLCRLISAIFIWDGYG